MSEFVSILEGQSSKQFNNVNYLRTSLQGGGYCDWVPAEDRELTDKSVTENGTYNASNETDSHGNPYWGYSEVDVNVPKKDEVEGKDPKDGGNDTSVSRDNNGNLVKTTLPSSIRVTTQPNKRTYENGESINTAGMVVTAYKNDGSVWGTVPLADITINPTKARADGTQGIWSKDGVHAAAFMCNVYASGDYIEGYHYASPVKHGTTASGVEVWTFLRRPSPGIVYYTKYFSDGEIHVYGCTPDGSSARMYLSKQSDGMDKGYGVNAAGVSSTANRFSASQRIEESSVPLILSQIPTSEVPPWTVDFSGAGTTNTITISWGRPKDGKILTTTFNVYVENPAEELS